MRALVVEKDGRLRAALAETLREAGMRVDCAADCKTAFSALACGRYDWATLGGHLDDGTGLEVLRVIGASYPEIRAVVVARDAANVLFRRQAEAMGAMLVVAHPAGAAAEALAEVKVCLQRVCFRRAG